MVCYAHLMTTWYIIGAVTLFFVIRWMYVTEQIEEVFAYTVDPDHIDSIPIATLNPGDIIYWQGDRNYYRTIIEVNDGPDDGLCIEFDDDFDCSWSVSPNQLHDLIDIYSY